MPNEVTAEVPAATETKPVAAKPARSHKAKPKTTPVPAAPPPPPVPFSLERILKEAVKEATPKVRANVIASLTQKEIDKREKAVMAAIVELEEVKIQIKQFKPDQELVDGTGTLQKFYNKDTSEKMKQKNERREKLERAIEAALDREDYGPILQAISK
jgi:hypothetical protein